jgi:hypothetical protein
MFDATDRQKGEWHQTGSCLQYVNHNELIVGGGKKKKTRLKRGGGKARKSARLKSAEAAEEQRQKVPFFCIE